MDSLIDMPSCFGLENKAPCGIDVTQRIGWRLHERALAATSNLIGGGEALCSQAHRCVHRAAAPEKHSSFFVESFYPLQEVHYLIRSEEREIIKVRDVNANINSQCTSSFQVSSRVDSGSPITPERQTSLDAASLTEGTKESVLTVTLPSGEDL